MAWLLDTNVLSELRRRRPEPKVARFLAAQPMGDLYVSVVTLAEIRFGIERAGEADRRAAVRGWLERQVRPMFEGRVLPITEDIMPAVETSGGRGPTGRTHLLAAGPDHRRDGARA